MTGTGPIVVTGAGGLVGRAVCRQLASNGSQFVPILRRAAADLPQGIVADLRTDPLGEALGDLRPATIVHCAALVPTNPAHADSDANAAGTRAIDANVHEAAVRTSAHMIYISSCGLYDPEDAAVKDETSDVRARSPYFAAKLDGERLFAALGGATIMRLSSPVGPSAPAHLVLPRFVAAALRGEPLTLWGSGAREQDFVDVDDVAAFIRLAIGAAPAGTFNVAAGAPVSMRTLADTIVAALGTGSVVMVDRPDPQEGSKARYSIAKAQNELGWRPAIAIDGIVRRLVAALRSSGHESG